MEVDQDTGGHIIDYLENKNDSDVFNVVFQGWIKATPENKQDFFIYTKIWDGANRLAKKKNYNAQVAWEKVNSQILRQTVVYPRFKRSLLSISVASILILFGISAYFGWFSQNRAEPLKLATELGSRSEAVLPDGTKVRLNAGSELTYFEHDKRKKVRKVQFSGEGYFEVNKNKKPFIVQLQNGLTVKVMGTKFNLSAYPDDSIIKTTLVEGKVELEDIKGEQLVLTSGQIGSFNKKSGELYYSTGKSSQSLGWIDRKLYMDNMPMEEVCRILERWYDVQIIFLEQVGGESIHYTGVLQEKSIYDIFEALNRISKIEYKIEGRNIIVSKRKF